MIREAAALLREKTRRLSHPLITDRHLELSILIYLRQSTPGQVRDNWGSTTLQEELVELALAYGWSLEQIIVINEDLGKSGSTTVGRAGWQQMLDLISDRNCRRSDGAQRVPPSRTSTTQGVESRVFRYLGQKVATTFCWCA
jgi:hypothetical protein